LTNKEFYAIIIIVEITTEYHKIFFEKYQKSVDKKKYLWYNKNKLIRYASVVE